eukprot:1149383-Pelagomonas_calceolata.AAC.2
MPYPGGPFGTVTEVFLQTSAVICCGLLLAARILRSHLTRVPLDEEEEEEGLWPESSPVSRRNDIEAAAGDEDVEQAWVDPLVGMVSCPVGTVLAYLEGVIIVFDIKAIGRKEEESMARTVYITQEPTGSCILCKGVVALKRKQSLEEKTRGGASEAP